MVFWCGLMRFFKWDSPSPLLTLRPMLCSNHTRYHWPSLMPGCSACCLPWHRTIPCSCALDSSALACIHEARFLMNFVGPHHLHSLYHTTWRMVRSLYVLTSPPWCYLQTWCLGSMSPLLGHWQTCQTSEVIELTLQDHSYKPIF